jgi:hypothetical protein
MDLRFCAVSCKLNIRVCKPQIESLGRRSRERRTGRYLNATIPTSAARRPFPKSQLALLEHLDHFAKSVRKYEVRITRKRSSHLHPPTCSAFPPTGSQSYTRFSGKPVRVLDSFLKRGACIASQNPCTVVLRKCYQNLRGCNLPSIRLNQPGTGFKMSNTVYQ